jgi:hypothetical protein
VRSARPTNFQGKGARIRVFGRLVPLFGFFGIA